MNINYLHFVDSYLLHQEIPKLLNTGKVIENLTLYLAL